MKTRLLLLGLSALIVMHTQAQSAGDYRRKQTGNWNDAINSISQTTGTAVKFNEISMITFSNELGNFGTDDFSIELWFKTDQSTHNAATLDKRSVCGYDNFWNVALLDGHAFFELCDFGGVNYYTAMSPLTYNDNLWHHLACTRAGTLLSVYVDGVLVTTTTTNQITNLNNSYATAMSRGLCGNFIGEVDEVRIWQGIALSQSDIEQQKCKNLQASEFNNLLAYFQFNEGEGTLTYDSKSNYTGELLDGTTWINSDIDCFIPADTDGDGVIDEEDCAPTDATKWQSKSLYTDADGDGYDAGQETVCYGATIPDGYSETSNGEDCNDDDALVHTPITYYADNDGDGFGDAANTTTVCSSTPPAGYVTNNSDCNDNDNTIYPGAPELPDGKDNDCDGETDEGTGTTWYEDADGDGFGNPDVSQIAVSQPEGYVADNTDCDDNHANINPYTVWYKDADDDGYSDGTNLTQCKRPQGYKLSSELTATDGDCNDDDPSVNPGAQKLEFSGSPLFTTSLVAPQTGTPYTDFSFEVKYTDASGALPPATFPRLLLDYEGDGQLDGPNDRTVIMSPADITDNNTADGKLYKATVNGLAEGAGWKTSVIITNKSCTVSTNAFDYPDVQVLPDLYLFANNISFSNNNPEVASALTVNTEINNASDFAAVNFYVHLINQYDGSTYTDVLVPYLAPHSATTVSWNITTPSAPAWCPMQVTVDYTNVITESEENNNTAIRPFINGNYNLPGAIDVTATASPSATYLGTGFITVSGYSKYTGTAVPLDDPSVAGATVNFTVTETGANFTAFTNASGQFNASIPLPNATGLYHITGSVTDYTLTGNFDAQFSVVESPCNPDLAVSVIPDATTITAGGSITGNIIVKNNGCAAVTVNTLLKITQQSGLPAIGNVSVPPLEPGAVFTLPFNLAFNTAGHFSVCAIADAAFEADEQDEGNNDVCITVNVLPAAPDIIPLGGPGGIIRVCRSPQNIGFSLRNSGGVATGAFTCDILVKRDNILIETKHSNIASIAANSDISFDVPYSYTVPGQYTFELTADAGNTVTELNEDNNSAVYTVTAEGCAADLVFTGCEPVNVVSVNGEYTGDVAYTATLANTGDAIAQGPVEVKFLLSDGTIYNAQYTGDLAPGQTGEVSVNGAVPSSPGTSITVTADPANLISEQSEANNSFTGNLCWDFGLTGRSDYGCALDFWERTYRPNQPVTFDIIVSQSAKNLYDAASLKVRFWVSGPGLNGNVNLGDAVLHNVHPLCNICGSGPGAALPVPFVFPEEGTYTVTMQADPDNEYPECDEANNTMAVNVQVKQAPDMRIFSQYISPSLLNPKPGENVSLDITYDNAGASNNNATMKLNTYIDDQLFASTYPVPGLISGDKHTISIPGTWSSGIVGAHVIRAVIDADNTIDEITKQNNEATRAIVVGEAANLYFKSLTPASYTPPIWSVLNIQAVIGNNGDIPCAATVEWYYRNDAGTLILTGTSPVSVNENGEATVSTSWTVSDVNTMLTARIVQASALEFTYDDNEASVAIGGLAVQLVAESSCGDGNGSLKAQVISGDAPFTYLWDNGFTGETLAAPAGNYSVTVSDASGQSVNITGTIPAGEQITWYRDADGDGFGDAANTTSECSSTPPSGYVTDNTDCNDGDNSIYPGAPELCDGKDNNCNGTIDEGCSAAKKLYRSRQSGTWEDAANWETFDGTNWVAATRYPYNADSTITIRSPHTITKEDNYYAIDDVTVEAGAALNLNAGKFTNGPQPADLRVYGTLNHNGGNHDNCGVTYEIYDGGVYNWNSGSYACSNINILAGGTMNFNVVYGGHYFNGVTVTNDGVINFNGGGFYAGGTASVIINNAGGVINKNNAALFRTTFGGNATFTQNGALNINAGNLDIRGVNFTFTGQMSIANNAKLTLNSSFNTTLGGTLTVVEAVSPPPANDTIIEFITSPSNATFSVNFSEINLPLGYSIAVNPKTIVLNYDEDIDDDGVLNEDDCAPTDATKWQSNSLYIDADGDGYDAGQETVCYGATIPDGCSENTSGEDCNDNDANVHSSQTYYADNDGDGFGDANNSINLCSSTPPSGYVSDHSDCDDTKFLYADNDGDGFGAGSPVACGVDNNTDCNDNNVSVHPGVVEICGNGVDDNCNGQVDEGCTGNNTIGISINDKSIKEGNAGSRLMIFYVKLSKASRRVIRAQYATQNGTAEAGSDYQASSGQLTFLPGVKRMPVIVLIRGDKIPEADETITVVLSNPVNADITDGTGVGTIRNDDIAPAASATQGSVKTAAAIKYARIMPNPAQTFVKVELTGYSGSVVLELSDLYGRKLQQQKIQVGKAKVYNQQIELTNYANGNYLIRVIDEKGKYQTLQLVIAR